MRKKIRNKAEDNKDKKVDQNIFVLFSMLYIVFRIGFHVWKQSVPEQRQLSTQLSTGQI